LKVLLNISIARFINGSCKIFKSGEVVDLPADEAERMIVLGRANRVDEPIQQEVDVQVSPKPKSTSKRGA
jgi:hypothetical protein